MSNSPSIAVLITAAGSSTRMGGGIKKEYLPFNNGTVLSNCAKSFLNALEKSSYKLTSITITYPAGKLEECKAAFYGDCELEKFSLPEVLFVEGSSTRQASVFNALKAIKGRQKVTPDIVLIHDGARPFITGELIFRVIKGIQDYGACVPGVVPTDTQKETDENGFIVRHLVRKNLRAVQTPQGFLFDRILSAHEKAMGDGREYTDDSEIWGAYEGKVFIAEGEVSNIKITYSSDLEKLK